ncbi:MAG: MarR family winged helix-turn-helix transcriptional regulator [Nakamurella sp.]
MTFPEPAAADPTTVSALRPLRLLLNDMDDDIGRLYDERGVADIRPRFSMTLIKLQHLGPLTIRQLAVEVDVTHSAMSQTVTAMRSADLVESAAGADARTRTISLTAKGLRLVPFLEAEWRATEAALAELDAEIPYPITQVIRDMADALRRRSFHDRIVENLTPGP